MLSEKEKKIIGTHLLTLSDKEENAQENEKKWFYSGCVTGVMNFLEELSLLAEIMKELEDLRCLDHSDCNKEKEEEFSFILKDCNSIIVKNYISTIRSLKEDAETREAILLYNGAIFGVESLLEKLNFQKEK